MQFMAVPQRCKHDLKCERGMSERKKMQSERKFLILTMFEIDQRVKKNPKNNPENLWCFF